MIRRLAVISIHLVYIQSLLCLCKSYSLHLSLNYFLHHSIVYIVLSSWTQVQNNIHYYLHCLCSNFKHDVPFNLPFTTTRYSLTLHVVLMTLHTHIFNVLFFTDVLESVSYCFIKTVLMNEVKKRRSDGMYIDTYKPLQLKCPVPNSFKKSVTSSCHWFQTLYVCLSSVLIKNKSILKTPFKYILSFIMVCMVWHIYS